jgi:glycosyltransferase involved in cell wall biosynthesis
MNDASLIDVDLLSPDRKSLRVAVVTETYPPDINGVARTLANTVQGLRNLGHTIQIIRPRHPGDRHAEAAAPKDVLVKGMPIPFYRQLRMGLPAKRELTRLWSMQRPDVVHIATEGPLGWSALKVARKLRLPVSTDFRTNFHSYTQHYGVGWLKTPIMAYLRKFHNAADSTMVPTAQLREELAAAGFDRLHVVSRGVDVQSFTPGKYSSEVRAKWGAYEQNVVLLCVSRMATEKNLHIVTQAYTQLLKDYPHLRLVMVGDGPSREVLQRKCPEAFFTGFLEEQELSAHYASADVFVFPSTTETFGNVILEAMASGLPAVAFDDAAARFLIRHKENGMLAQCGDLAAFQSNIDALVRDASMRKRQGELARQTAMLKSWDNIYAQVEQVLLQVGHENGVRS